MSIRGSWRVSLRIARRDVLRAKGRNLLVVLMIGIPVLLVAGMSVTLRSASASAETATLRSLGAAEAVVKGVNRRPIRQHPTNPGLYLDDNSPPEKSWSAAEIAKATGRDDIAPLREGKVLLTTSVGGLGAKVRELDLRNKLTAGLGDITDGRSPERADEVLVSASLVKRRMDVGTTLRVKNGKTYSVVGIVRNPEDFKGMAVVALPGAMLGDDATAAEFLVGGDPMRWEQIRELNKLGLQVISRTVLQNPPPDSQVEPRIVRMANMEGDASWLPAIAGIGAIVLLEIVLLAGPAFVVGARRQSRQLALYVVIGGTPRDVRRVVLAQALVLGLGTAVLGSVLGIVAYLGARPVIETVYGRAIPDLALDAGDFGMLIGTGVLASFVAALVPAYQASRQDTVAALGGRRGEVRTKRRWPIAGAVMAAIGLVILVGWGVKRDADELVIVGTVALALGAILAMPAIVGLVGRVAGALPLALRLAARDTARHRSRTVPAIAAIMGTVLTVTALAVLVYSDIAAQKRDYLPHEPMGTLTAQVFGQNAALGEELLQAVERELPGRDAVLLSQVDPSIESKASAALVVPGRGCEAPEYVDCQPLETVNGGYTPVVVTPDSFAARFGRKPTAKETQTLDAGGVLVPFESVLTKRGTAHLLTYRPGDLDRTKKRVEVPATYVPPFTGAWGQKFSCLGVISDQTATRLGLTTRFTDIVVPPGGPEITSAQQARVAEILNGSTDIESEVYVERGYDDPFGWYLFIALAVIGGLIVLVGTATSTALALDDAKADFATLSAIGASPGTRRRAAMGQAVVIAALGVIAGVAVGLVAGIAMAYRATSFVGGGLIIDIPWELLGIVAVAVPLFAIVGAGVFTRSRLTLVRRAD
jgi:putative ABC transport system permease protein